MGELITTFLLLAFVSTTGSHAATYNIVDHGANPDERFDSTKAVLAVWSAACGSIGPTTILVPTGRFLVGPAVFNGPCKSTNITVQLAGALVAPSDYASFEEDWLLFDHVDGVSIAGGTIDGQGQSLWSCKAAGHTCPHGAASLVFQNSRNIGINGLTSMNSKLYHIVINNCQDVMVQGVQIIAPASSHNTDGIHVQMSTDVTIIGGEIGTGDDCISIGPGTSGLWIQHVSCGPGHGISIGSLGKELEEAGVHNVTVTNVTFTGTENGARIKTWGRPSSSFVRDVLFQHLTMRSVRNPVIINQNYCEEKITCPHQNSGVKISQVTYNDIQGSSASLVAVDFSCSRSNPCTGLIVKNIKLVFPNIPAKSLCQNAIGSGSTDVPPSCLVSNNLEYILNFSTNDI